MEDNLYLERYRPQFHFSAPRGWLNDPNGLIFYRGEYHLFYQYNPNDICWGAPSWGHAVSEDMVHWKHLSVALEPDALGSIFSGTIVADDDNTSGLFDREGGLVAVFTHDKHGIGEYQSIAYSSDCGRTWTKYAGNPVLRGGNGPEWKDFRDPKVFRYQGQWMMVLGGGRYRFYTSPDLIHWKLLSDMAVFEEFPDLFPLSDRWILNVNGYGYYVGDLTSSGFTPSQPIRAAEFANSWQACYTFSDMPDKRTVWLAWMRDAAKGPTETWRCNMSVPRELKLVSDGDQLRVLQAPVRELETLREPYYEAGKDSCPDLSAVHGQCLDIEAVFAADGPEPLVFRCFEQENRYLEIGFRPDEQLFYVDTRAASDPSLAGICTMFPAYMSINGNQQKILAKIFTTFLPAREYLKLRILLDVSTAEIFVNDGELTFTVNVYPEEKADGISLVSGAFRSLKVWKMKSIWR